MIQIQFILVNNYLYALPINNDQSKTSNLDCQVVLRSFGDSHADIVQVEVLKNIPDEEKKFFKAYSYSNHGKLMNSIGRDGLNIFNLLSNPKTVTIRPWNQNERKKKLFDLIIPGVIWGVNENSIAPTVTDKDILYFVFGEIDARIALNDIMTRHRRTDLFNEINRLVDNYWNSIQRAVYQIPAKTVWIGGLHPQPKMVENTNNWSGISGTFEKRWLHTLLINRKLKMYCEKYGYFFIDFTDGYSMPDGDLDMKMTDGNHHLNFWTEKTKNEIAQQLIAHRNKVC